MDEKYKEIINLPHHVSSTRTPMPRADRAAQFAPYSALSGYEDAVEETARILDQPIEIDESEKEKINTALTSLLSSPPDTKAKITFFRPDEKKSGGAYITITDEIGKFDEIAHEITLVCGTKINLHLVTEIVVV